MIGSGQESGARRASVNGLGPGAGRGTVGGPTCGTGGGTGGRGHDVDGRRSTTPAPSGTANAAASTLSV